jgi:hypothetical protein
VRGEGRREKGEGRREKGEGRREKEKVTRQLAYPLPTALPRVREST